MYRENRARGVTVKVLDMSELEASALSYRQVTKPDCYEAKIYGGQTAVATAKDGTLYTICTEGVGYEVSEDNPFEAEFHGSYYMRDEDQVLEDGTIVPGEIKPGSHSFDVMPFGSIELSPEELLAHPVKEEVDLVDFVRTFGARLESNFQLWYDILSK